MMNKKYFDAWRLLFVLSFCLTFAGALEAAGETGVGARDSGLGGSLTALADDADSLYYNPAGLIHLIQNQVSTTYGFINNGVKKGGKADDWSVSCGVPVGRRIGAVGVTWRDVSEPGLYREQMAALGFGRPIIGRWALGIGARYLNRKSFAAAGDPAGLGDVSRTVGVDAGVLGRLGAHWSIGVMANGLNEPERAFSYRNKGAIRSGIGLRLPSFSIAGQFNVESSSEGSGKDLFV